MKARNNVKGKKDDVEENLGEEMRAMLELRSCSKNKRKYSCDP